MGACSIVPGKTSCCRYDEKMSRTKDKCKFINFRANFIAILYKIVFISCSRRPLGIPTTQTGTPDDTARAHICFIGIY